MTTFPNNTQSTFSQKGQREDLSDVIYNVDPTDTPFLSSIAKTNATHTLHEWQTDALGSASSGNAVIEGVDATTDAHAVTARLTNDCQILDKVPRVTGTAEANVKAGRGSEMEYQIAKRAKELKRDIETTLFLNVAKTDGDVSNARKLGGIQTWLSSNDVNAGDATGSTGLGANARTDGTARAFTEALMKTALKSIWDAGGDPDCIMVDAFNKQAMSTFTGNATRFKGAEDKSLYAAIDIYDSDFGELQIIPNRFQTTSNSSDGAAFILQKDMLAVAYLRPFRLFDLAKTGDTERKQLITELTLESRNEAASGAVYDLTKS